MRIKPSQKEISIEKAIIMLVDCVRENCKNPKPLILHSIRVGMKLMELNQPKQVVIAGILHDLIEDTNLTIAQIKKEFGPKVANLVSAITQEEIENYKERWRVLMKKIKKAGKPAMIIKVIDIYDNLHYVKLIKDKPYLKTIQWRHNFAMTEMRPYIGHLKVFKNCRRDYKIAFKTLGI